MARAVLEAMRRYYSVAGRKGVLVRASMELDSAVVATLPKDSACLGDVQSCVESTKGSSRLRLWEPVEGWCSPRLLTAGDLGEDAAESLARHWKLPPMRSGHPCPLLVSRPCHERRGVATIAMG